MSGGPSAAQAQDYPTRPITIVVPLAPGSGLDSLVRVYANKLQQSLGQPVIVENKPGAALMLAAQYVAKATPGGYTLLVSTSSAMAINLILYKKVNYDAAKDFIGLLPIDRPSVADTETYLAGERQKWSDLVRKLALEGSQ
jgi:tripartite-type tricarboxylate transporter receptor subunit TctC